LKARRIIHTSVFNASDNKIFLLLTLSSDSHLTILGALPNVYPSSGEQSHEEQEEYRRYVSYYQGRHTTWTVSQTLYIWLHPPKNAGNISPGCCPLVPRPRTTLSRESASARGAITFSSNLLECAWECDLNTLVEVAARRADPNVESNFNHLISDN
jgi:hypothetical protein